MNYENSLEAAEFIKSRYSKPIDLALVLGSGLGGFADEVENRVNIPYEEIPHFSRSTVDGHAGRLVLGEIGGVTIAVQQGRFHYYEGYEISKVVFPVRTFGALGIKKLILTNAAGSVRTSFRQGDLMLIRDHINFMGVNPLLGQNDERFGVRFPDMTHVYSNEFQEIAVAEARKMEEDRNIGRFLHRGVYIGLSGPNYETPSEIRMLRLWGGDAVGMSTVPEALAARHQGMEILGISCITNLASGISDETINHDEVMETGARVADIFQDLLRRVIPKLK
jgi:purine-nucleoside phosphorylase